MLPTPWQKKRNGRVPHSRESSNRILPAATLRVFANGGSPREDCDSLSATNAEFVMNTSPRTSTSGGGFSNRGTMSLTSSDGSAIKISDGVPDRDGGGAADRKKKLLKKQKKGKARSKQFGRVEIPQEAFIGVLKINKET